MRVLFWGRADLFDFGGGDLIQIETTAAHLRKLGVDVHVSADVNEDISDYDIIHVFQMDWTPETYFYAKNAHDGKKPLVLSPIHHSVSEVKRFDDEYTFGLRKVIGFLFKEQHLRDTWKNIYRSFRDSRKLKPTIFSVFMGLKGMHKKTLNMSDVVLVQTEAEANDLTETYGVDIDWVKVSNGVGELFIEPTDYENQLDVEDYILCVGRIEARKNNLRVIEAVEAIMKSDEIDLNLVFVGRKNANHGIFVEEFEKKVAQNSWITYIPQKHWEEMPALYHFAKVLVSASWFETSGLTIMEAVFSGANAVGAGERVKEIMGDLISYCDPGDVSTIAQAIKEQYNAKRPEVSQGMKKEYTWDEVARRTKKVYDDLLNK